MGLLAGQKPTMDDVSNLNNVLGRARFNNSQVKVIDNTMKQVVSQYGPPEFYTGHSRG